MRACQAASTRTRSGNELSRKKGGGMNMTHRIDVQKLAEEATWNRFHTTVLLWCFVILVFDGYDLAVGGVALPSIMKDMGVDATKAGFMLSSALFGMMFGA